MRLIQKLGLLLFICSLGASSYGQNGDSLSRSPLLNIKFDAFGFAHPNDPSLIGTIEYFILPDWVSLSHSLGSVMSIKNYDNVEVKQSLRFGTEFRVYLQFLTLPSEPKLYVGASYQYRRLVVNERYVLGYECDDRDCIYYRDFRGDLTTNRTMWQGHFGFQGNFSHRFFYEIDVGIGSSSLILDRTPLEGGELVEQNRFIEERDLNPHDVFSLSGKIGFRILRRKNNK